MRVLAIFAASFSAAVFLSVYSGGMFALLLPGGVAGIVTAALLLLGKTWKSRGRAAALCAAGLAVGFLWTFGYQMLFVEPAREIDGQTLHLTGRVLGWPEENGQGYTILTRLQLPGGGTADTLLYTDEQGWDLQPGDRVESVVRCHSAQRTYSGEEITHYTARGVFLRGEVCGTLTAVRPERLPLWACPAVLSRMLKENIIAAFPEGSAAIVLAIVTGERGLLSESFSAAMERVGLSHIMAVSGMHLACLSGALAFVMGRHRRRTALIVIPAAVLFALVTGGSPSVVRAAVMMSMLMAAPLFERERDEMTSLTAALLVLLLHNPLSAAHVGLQLSFASVAGIFLISAPAEGWLRRRLRIWHYEKWSLKWFIWWLPNYFITTLAVTLGALALTTPLCALYFSTLPLVSPLSNFLALWVVGLVFCGGLCAALVGSFWTAGAQVLAAVVTPLTEYLEYVAQWLSGVPFAAITMDSFYYKLWTILLSFAILSMLVKPRKEVIAAFGLMCAVTLPMAIGFTTAEFYADPMKVTVLDVGQGQSVLLRQGSHLTLVDCGGDSYDNAGNIAADHIQNAGRGSVDLLVLTHFHDDHANGVPQLLRRLTVKRMAVPAVEEDSRLRQEILDLAKEKGVECMVIREDTLLTPDAGSRVMLYAPLGTGDTNEEGLTVLAGTGEADALLTGDMGSDVEQLLLAHTRLPHVEVMLAGHHGSQYATSHELLTVTDPEMVLISVGKNNLYGHPAPDTLERLEGREVFRTDLAGTITVGLSGA